MMMEAQYFVPFGVSSDPLQRRVFPLSMFSKAYLRTGEGPCIKGRMSNPEANLDYRELMVWPEDAECTIASSNRYGWRYEAPVTVTSGDEHNGKLSLRFRRLNE